MSEATVLFRFDGGRARRITKCDHIEGLMLGAVTLSALEKLYGAPGDMQPDLIFCEVSEEVIAAARRKVERADGSIEEPVVVTLEDV